VTKEVIVTQRFQFRITRRPAIALLILMGIMLLAAPSAHAAEGGYSNYVPGTYGDFAAAVEPSTKFTVRNDIYYYQADIARSVRSGLIEADADLEFISDFLTLLYKPEVEIFGAHYAFGVLIPFVHADIDTGIRIGNLQVRQQDDTFGLGDITLIPAVLFWNHGNFHFTLAEYIVTPTGEYDTNDLANTGLNYWTFDTNFAVTYLNEKTGQDYSVNIGYNYNTENSDTNYQTGREIHIDYMINQFLSESFAIGVHGFYLKQVSGDSGDGAILGDFKAEAAGIGPAVLWSPKRFDQKITFIAKWLHEYDTERRIEGDHVFVSFAMSF
jgi:hypothetical protein